MTKIYSARTYAFNVYKRCCHNPLVILCWVVSVQSSKQSSSKYDESIVSFICTHRTLRNSAEHKRSSYLQEEQRNSCINIRKVYKVTPTEWFVLTLLKYHTIKDAAMLWCTKCKKHPTACSVVLKLNLSKAINKIKIPYCCYVTVQIHNFSAMPVIHKSAVNEQNLLCSLRFPVVNSKRCCRKWSVGWSLFLKCWNYWLPPFSFIWLHDMMLRLKCLW